VGIVFTEKQQTVGPYFQILAQVLVWLTILYEHYPTSHMVEVLNLSVQQD
jgi:hypothetical protein